MTGEITLRGRVLPIGGLKEKAMAARRGGISTILIPEENEKDIKDIPVSVRKALNIKLVKHVDEVLESALIFDEILWKGRAAKEMDEEARPPLAPGRVVPSA